MTKKRLVLRSFYVVLAIAIAGAAIVFIKLEVIPDLDNAAVVDSRTYDDHYAPVIGAVSEKLDGYRASLAAPSISLAIAVKGKLVWAETRGYAKLDGKQSATLDTVYAIGSVSKPITSALVAALWEEGAIDLDTDIRQYVANFPEKAYPITLRQLLSHQAGIRHYEFAWILPTFSEMARNEKFDSVEQSLTLFKDDSLLFEPDTSFKYSTYGYTLVSAVVEGATGRPFLDLLPEQDIVIAMAANTIGKGGSGPLTRVAASVARDFLDFEADSGTAATTR